MVERFNDRVPGDFESAAQIIPDRDAELVTRFGETEESITTIPTDVASCPGADLTPRDLTTNIVLRTVCMERDFRPFEHHQQLGLIGMQPHQQAVQRGEASGAKPVGRSQCGAGRCDRSVRATRTPGACRVLAGRP